MATRSPYREALLRARQAAGALDARSAQEVVRALRTYADNLARMIAGLDPGEFRRSQEAALRAVNAAARRLDVELAASIGNLRGISFEQVLGIWREAMEAVASAEGVGGALLGRVRGSPITLLGHYARLNAGKHWRTLIREGVVNAAAEADRILILGAQEGIGPEELARRLRRYVQGSEKFDDLFEEVPALSGGVAKVDLRKVPHRLRHASRDMVNNSRRIAFTETHNARAEAEAQHFREDPFVAVVKWTLSPVRSTIGWTGPCECDYLASTDAYGLGPGIFPVDAVPPNPHPWCRCLAGWTPVLTSTGWRRLDEIRIGESVLTHRGRWQEVTELFHGEETGGWLRLELESGESIEITDDHRVRVPGGWVEAGSLRPGDLVVGLQGLPNDDANEAFAGRPAGRAPSTVPVEDQERPSLVSQVLRLPRVLLAFLGRSMPPAMDLDREARCRYGHVDVPALDRPQRLGSDLSGPKTTADLTLVPGHSALISVSGLGLLSHLVDRLLPAPEVAYAMPAGSLLFSRAVPIPEHVGLAHATARDPVVDEVLAQDPPRHPESFGYRVLRKLFGHVHPVERIPVENVLGAELTSSRVRHVERLSLRLHRYCIAVANDNSFVAGGVVVHNCERVPVTRAAADVGKAKPGGVQPSALDDLRLRFATDPDQDRRLAARMTPLAAERAREHAWEAIRFGIEGRRGRRAA